MFAFGSAVTIQVGAQGQNNAETSGGEITPSFTAPALVQTSATSFNQYNSYSALATSSRPNFGPGGGGPSSSGFQEVATIPSASIVPLPTSASNAVRPTPTRDGNPLPNQTTTPTSLPSGSGSASAGEVTSSVLPLAAKKTNVGAIAGGAVGGILGLALILGILFLVLRRHKQRKSATLPTKESAYGVQDHSHSTHDVYESASYQPPKAHDSHVYAPQPVAGVYHADARSSPAAAATTIPHDSVEEAHMPMSREVNSDGVSLRSASPDLEDMAQRNSFEEGHHGRSGIPRLPLNRGASRRGPAL
ncbi:MAG: hypothetical protein M1814_005668 [Vezdaea aestivalis]|nr:MAG: hypothetical protein M1814_005668 [Vezdaea aestivalis]